MVVCWTTIITFVATVHQILDGDIAIKKFSTRHYQKMKGAGACVANESLVFRFGAETTLGLDSIMPHIRGTLSN